MHKGRGKQLMVCGAASYGLLKVPRVESKNTQRVVDLPPAGAGSKEIIGLPAWLTQR